MKNQIINTGGQSCLDNPNIYQQGNTTLGRDRQVIIPKAVFNCSGRVTRITVSIASSNSTDDLPVFQIWRPLSPGSSVYRKIVQVQITDTIVMEGNYRIANATISDINVTEFQSGDVIGYYQGSDLIWNIQSDGYTSYTIDDTNNSTTAINISDVVGKNQQQPLIHLIIGENYFYHSYIHLHFNAIPCNLSTFVYVLKYHVLQCIQRQQNCVVDSYSNVLFPAMQTICFIQ